MPLVTSIAEPYLTDLLSCRRFDAEEEGRPFLLVGAIGHENRTGSHVDGDLVAEELCFNRPHALDGFDEVVVVDLPVHRLIDRSPGDPPCDLGSLRSMTCPASDLTSPALPSPKSNTMPCT